MTKLEQLTQEAVEIIALHMCVRPEAILSSKRGGWEVSDARFILYSVLAFHGYSYPEIGKVIGDRDRTSVIHGINQIKERRLLGNSERRLKGALLKVSEHYNLAELWAAE